MATPLSKDLMASRSTGWLYKDKTIHAGFDYGVEIGSPLYAVRGGRILAKVDTIDNLDKDVDGKPKTKPNFVLLGITYKGTPATVVYLHISPNLPVEVGDKVAAGDLIALSGHNGHSTGPHLHVSALKGHNHLAAFDYLTGLKGNTKAPNGIASNNLTIYPPSLVYGQEGPHKLDSGDVVVSELVFGTTESVSVKKLQRLLNRIPLVDGRHLVVDGTYSKATRAQVRRWQQQLRHLKPGSPKADGNVHPKQAEALFKSPPFRLV
jgi:murein DD-endopeptidase MepM/ murein hydrolase activator NlpD